MQAATPHTPGTSLTDKFKGEGQLFSPRDQYIYTDQTSMTRIHKEEVLKLANRSLRLKELAGRQEEFTRQIKDIPTTENLLYEVG